MNATAEQDRLQAAQQTDSDDRELQQATELRKSAEKEVMFTPVGHSEPIRLTMNMVKTMLCRPSRRGVRPERGDIIKFMMLCKIRGLNPWEGDCELVGYDEYRRNEYVGTSWSIITTHQAYLKRANLADGFLGKKSGIVTIDKEENIHYLGGTIAPPSHKLMGGWCQVLREDRETEKLTVNLSAYEKDNHFWKSDPWGMITKTAECRAPRHEYPQHFGGMATSNELSEQQMVQAAIDLEETEQEKADNIAAADEQRREQEKVAQQEPAENEVVSDEVDEKEPESEDSAESVPRSVILEALAKCQTPNDVGKVYEDYAHLTDTAWLDKCCDERIEQLAEGA